MKTRHVVLQNEPSIEFDFTELEKVAQALQTQVDRDFTPVWGIHALVQALAKGERVPTGAWPIRILKQPETTGLGVHLDKGGNPFAEIKHEPDNAWSITASHELLEMLVDPLGHKLVRAPDIDPDSDPPRHAVEYLVEVADPCEKFTYQINGVDVSDFITPEYYNTRAPGTEFDFLNQLNHAFEVQLGCYLSWFDPQDGHWHQQEPNGEFNCASQKAKLGKNPRDERDLAFAEATKFERHNLPHILKEYGVPGLGTSRLKPTTTSKTPASKTSLQHTESVPNKK